MADTQKGGKAAARKRKAQEAVSFLEHLGFGPRQTNDTAAYSLLACLNLLPDKSWHTAASPLIGITPIIEFIARHYGVRYAPNSRETIRDEAIKYFVDAGLLLRNPDDPRRPTNSAKTVYQVEPKALELAHCYSTPEWPVCLATYLSSRQRIAAALRRTRELSRIPVRLPSGQAVSISPGGQNPLIKKIIEEFCSRFAPGGIVAYIGDAENKFLHLQSEYLENLGVSVPAPAKMPDVVIHDMRRNWLFLIEAVASAGAVDAKRRKELSELFAGCIASLVFVTAFATRAAMRSVLPQISWETEVWVAEDPDHMIHFDGERFLGPYLDVMAKAK